MALTNRNQSPSIGKAYFYFVVKSDEKVSGPYSSSEILRLIANKQLSFRHYCWRSGFREWRPIISTDDFRSEFHGDAQNDPVFPKEDIPNEVERSSTYHISPQTKPVKNKRVVVTFAKTKIKRMSIYEWCFALLFSMLFAFFSADWVLTELVANVKKEHERVLVGRAQKIGDLLGVETLPEFSLDPLYSAPGIVDSDLEPIAIKVFGNRVGQTSLRNSLGSVVEINDSENQQYWSPEQYGLEGIYQKPLHVSGYLSFSSNKPTILVSHPGTPIRSP